MTMRDCAECGKPVRLRAMKMRVHRSNGISHYIEHTDGSGMHGPGWGCLTLKPYPKVEAEKPWNQMVDRWNLEQEPRSDGE